MVHMILSRRLRQDQVEDERVDTTCCVGPCYPYFVVFIVLDHRGILVFWFFASAYKYDPRGMCLLVTSSIFINTF
jgi:hypothetical protein